VSYEPGKTYECEAYATIDEGMRVMPPGEIICTSVGELLMLLRRSEDGLVMTMLCVGKQVPPRDPPWYHWSHVYLPHCAKLNNVQLVTLPERSGRPE